MHKEQHSAWRDHNWRTGPPFKGGSCRSGLAMCFPVGGNTDLILPELPIIYEKYKNPDFNVESLHF